MCRHSKRTTYVCQRVFDGAQPAYVYRDDDGELQVLCEQEHANQTADGPIITCLGCVLASLPELAPVVAQIRPLESAARDADGEWTIYERSSDATRDQHSDAGAGSAAG